MANIIGFYQSPIGLIEIIVNDDRLIAVKFLDEIIEINQVLAETSDIIDHTIAQLTKYFNGNLKQFDLPVTFKGTVFQIKVWEELMNIPFGKTISYLQLAKSLGSEKLVRAVGNSNGKNPIAIIVPCHRVIGINSKLVGYAGGLWRKQWLLEHESNQKSFLF